MKIVAVSVLELFDQCRFRIRFRFEQEGRTVVHKYISAGLLTAVVLSTQNAIFRSKANLCSIVCS